MRHVHLKVGFWQDISVIPLKIRQTSSGVHLFDRRTGLNILLEPKSTGLRAPSLAPRQISVALSNACDLRCSYCYAPKTSGRLRLDDVVGWLADLDQAGCLGVGFGGGEPTLLRDFPHLCQRLAAETQLAITFTTHGHHLDAALCSRLQDTVHFVRISMDGVGETYERLRGRSFSALLDRLADVRTLAPFGINYVVNDDTIGELDAAVAVAVDAGAREFLLLPEQPTSARSGIDSETMASLHAWVNAYQGSLALTVSAAAADGLPVTAPLPREEPLEAYAHIDANGTLKRSSYDDSGVAIGDGTIMQALAALREMSEGTA
ncbi:radical SAM protein [Nonomuraea sp. NEAU-A123]|uniref:radical SAM protein n=1 Tax=Nonomuraea sp. NEAU-A123 TaxID=2839649 RepID=UPI001BE3F81A|nr:radical SAM protein [Nonomuraea sp. NEAU-A123]MBT2225124.1 radical SAM protein [Nonomuraea sp. NEAU-A123]